MIDKQTDFELSKLQKQIDRSRAKSSSTTIIDQITNTQVANGQSTNIDNSQPVDKPDTQLIKVVTINKDHTISDEDMVISNSVYRCTVILPIAVIGKRIIIANINTSTVIINAYQNDFIDKQATINLTQWQTMELICYAENSWKIISKYSG